MSNTWNFPCYTCSDWGSFDSANRGAHGMAWILDPAYSTNQPFTNTITGIFSLFIRSGWTDRGGVITQVLTSIGNGSEAKNGLFVSLGASGGNYSIGIQTNNRSTGTALHEVLLGDEDGAQWIQPDKWYQVAFSMSGSAFSYAINGTTSPQMTVVSSTNGDMNLDPNTSRWMHLSGAQGIATQISSNLLTAGANWPTCVVGASAWSDHIHRLDISDSA